MQLDETPRVMGQEETLQLRHLVSARVDDYRLSDGMVDY